MQRPGPVARVTVAVACLVATPACDRGDLAARMAAPPSLADAGMAHCAVAGGGLRPFVVEWPGADRGALELKLSRGVVAVRHDGCELEVLADCHVPEDYVYAGFTRKRDALTIRSADELYARLPVGAARLEPTLTRARELHVDMTLVGMVESRRADYSRAELTGRCARATHVISGAQVGAFTFSAGATGDVLNQDGAPQACEAASSADRAAPEGCRALVRIELTPLLPGLRPMAVLPPPVARPAERFDASDRPPRRRNNSDEIGPHDAEIVELRRFGRAFTATGVPLLALGLAGIPMLAIGHRREATSEDRGEAADLKIAGAATAFIGLSLGTLFVVAGARHLRRASELNGDLARWRVAPQVGRSYGGLHMTFRF